VLSDAAAAESYASKIGLRSEPNLFEVFEGHAACRRNLGAIGHQAMRDAFAVRDELSTNGLGIHHAGILILLCIGPYGPRFQDQANQDKECSADFHGPTDV
jgi:hypothetical protein